MDDQHWQQASSDHLARCAAEQQLAPGTVAIASHPLPRTTIEIVSTEVGQTPLPAGQIGEICVRGLQVMLGYWKQPAATADALVSGRLRTGDIVLVRDVAFVGDMHRYVLEIAPGLTLVTKQQHRYHVKARAPQERMTVEWHIEDTLVV